MRTPSTEAMGPTEEQRVLEVPIDRLGVVPPGRDAVEVGSVGAGSATVVARSRARPRVRFYVVIEAGSVLVGTRIQIELEIEAQFKG